MINPHARAARIQVAFAPSAPSTPPPNALKRVSIGATVWPAVTHHAAPRQTSRPPSVTMKEGIAEIGDQPALEQPDGAADQNRDEDRERAP